MTGCYRARSGPSESSKDLHQRIATVVILSPAPKARPRVALFGDKASAVCRIQNPYRHSAIAPEGFPHRTLAGEYAGGVDRDSVP